MDQKMVELLRAQRQLDHEHHLCIFKWLDNQLTDIEFLNAMRNATVVFTERMAPYMDKEPKR